MTTTQQANFLVYDRALGMTVMEGKGFYYPVDTVAGKDDRLYVISRSKEETTRGIRVTICDLESGYYGNFGGYGFDGGQFVWPSCGAVDSQGRFYISDERLHRVTAYSPEGSYLLHWGEQGRRGRPVGHSHPVWLSTVPITCTWPIPTITGSRSSPPTESSFRP